MADKNVKDTDIVERVRRLEEQVLPDGMNPSESVSGKRLADVLQGEGDEQPEFDAVDIKNGAVVGGSEVVTQADGVGDHDLADTSVHSDAADFIDQDALSIRARTFATASDVPSDLDTGTIVHVEDEDQLYQQKVGGFEKVSPGLPISQVDSAETFGEPGLTISTEQAAYISDGSIQIITSTGVIDEFEQSNFDILQPDINGWDIFALGGSYVDTVTGVSGMSGTQARIVGVESEGVNMSLTYNDGEKPSSDGFSFSFKAQMETKGSYNETRFIWYSDGGRVGGLWFDDNTGNMIWKGDETTLQSWSLDVTYDISVTFNFSTNTADVTVDGDTNTVDFEDNSSNIDQFSIKNRQYNSTGDRILYIDDVDDSRNREGYYEGTAFIEFSAPEDIFRWDAASFTTTEDGETVEVYVEESTDGGSTWTEIDGPINRGDMITAAADSEVRFRVELDRADKANNPTLDSIYRRYVV